MMAERKVQSIGITGGIGTGKSTICRIFKLLGVPVFEADTVAKQLYDTNTGLGRQMTRLFGKEIWLPNGKIDRKKLAAIIFNEEEMLNKVNELIHPLVWSAYQQFLKSRENSPYIIHEAAILIESGFDRNMDFTILVTAPYEACISRVMKRDGISRELVLSRMSRQWSEEKKRSHADFILENNNRNLIIPQIIQIDKNLKENGKIW